MPKHLRAVTEQPTRDGAPELDEPIAVKEPTSLKIRILAMTYLQGEPTDGDFRHAEILTGLSNGAATAELAAAQSALAAATAELAAATLAASRASLQDTTNATH